MMLVVALLATLQTTGWRVSPAEATVGDTVVLEYDVIAADPGLRLHVSRVESSDAVEPLRDPEVIYQPWGMRVRHVVAVFLPGAPVLTMPNMEFLYPQGRIDVVPGGEVTLAVRSVLPDLDSLPPPRWSLGPIARPTRRREPVVILTGAALALVTAWALVRRRSRQRPVWEASGGDLVEAPLAAWVASGEPRAVVAQVMAGLRGRVAQLVPTARTGLDTDECVDVLTRERPQWPVAELAQVMRALERASFAPAVGDDVLGLAQRATDVVAALDDDGEAET